MTSSVPFVSSSPPPMEGNLPLAWNENEDDFGTFASAPGILTSGCDVAQQSKFDADSSDSPTSFLAVCSGGQGNSGKGIDSHNEGSEAYHTFEGHIHTNDYHAKSGPELDKEEENESYINNEDVDDFADFTSFQENSSRESKLHIAKLPLQNVNLPGLDSSKECSDSEVATLEPAVAKRQESAVLDSGVFSSDLSPVPISESISSSGGDNTVLSEDECVSELPHKLPAEHVHDECIENSVDQSKVLTSVASDTDSVTEHTSGSFSAVKHPQNRPKSVHVDRYSQEDNQWAAFEASHSIPSAFPESGNTSDSYQSPENEEVLRTESAQFIGHPCGVPSAELMLKDKENTNVLQNCISSKIEDSMSEGKIDIANVRDQTSLKKSTEPIQHDHSIPEGSKDRSSDFSLENKISGGASGDNVNDNFSLKEEIDHIENGDDFGDFSSRKVAPNSNSSTNADDDDFGDFTFQPVSSLPSYCTNDFGALSKQSESACDQDDFCSFSEKSVTAADNNFGDFTGQAGTASSVSDAGWANFASSSVSTEKDDFGDFSDSKPAAVQQSSLDHAASWTGDKIWQSRFERTLLNCFPGCSSSVPISCEITAHSEETNKEDDHASGPSNSKEKLGVLETILKYGIQYHSVSQQTSQTVQRPSEKDSRIKLWSHLQDVDGSPAVGYQWSKSVTNSHVFHTLHIDTQNMLIGHKKPSVPVLTTGLSLLEPTREGRRERMLAAGDKSAHVSTSQARGMHSHTLTDLSQQNEQKTSQDVPAVHFDWSSSGLTNPLTSNSLDLDFLGVQDSHAPDKSFVVESKLSDRPGTSTRLSVRILEDILKKVRLTDVFSRRNSGSSCHLSSEAVEVLADFPDLSFMQSKVLMFPVTN